MRIALLGAPGAGKGVQADRLAEGHGIPPIPPMDLVREAITAGSALGQLARAALDASQPVPDEIFLALIRDRLSQPDAQAGFILDGFPRTLVQAEALDAMLAQLGKTLELVLLIDVDLDLLMQRLSGRWTCQSCGWTCNIYSSPPRVDGVCDLCGGNLRHRADDNEETIDNRFRGYEAQAGLLNRYYRIKGVLREVDGSGDVGQVADALEMLVASAARESGMTGAPAEVMPAKRAPAVKKVTNRQDVTAKKVLPPATAPPKPAPTARKAATKKVVVTKASAGTAVLKKAPGRAASTLMAVAKAPVAARKAAKAPVKKMPVAKPPAPAVTVKKLPAKKATKQAPIKAVPKRKVVADKPPIPKLAVEPAGRKSTAKKTAATKKSAAQPKPTAKAPANKKSKSRSGKKNR